MIPGLADAVNRRGRHDGYVWAALVSVGLIAPLTIGALNPPTATSSTGLAGLAFMPVLGFGVLCASTVPLLPLSTRRRRRGRG